jgi:SAM-dependent methyltransferase
MRLHEFVCAGDFLDLPVPSPQEQPDLVISNSVLEHVRDPAAIFRACYAWLKPGGMTFYQIDLRDHNFGFRKPFEMLAYSDDVWKRWIDLRGGFHLNRWRITDYRQAFAQAGFVNSQESVVMADLAGAQAMRPRLHQQFRHLADSDLAIQMVILVGQRTV